MFFRLRGESPDNAEGIVISDNFKILIYNDSQMEWEHEIEKMMQTIRAVFTEHSWFNSLIDYLLEQKIFLDELFIISRRTMAMTW